VAQRETREEAGLDITVEGILRVQHTPVDDGSARMRVIFLASPEDGATVDPAGGPDALQARWVTIDEAAELPLRGTEVLEMFEYVMKGHPIHPLSLLGPEGISI